MGLHETRLARGVWREHQEKFSGLLLEALQEERASSNLDQGATSCLATGLLVLWKALDLRLSPSNFRLISPEAEVTQPGEHLGSTPKSILSFKGNEQSLLIIAHLFSSPFLCCSL